jgi:signal transduction histidine kinase
MRALRARRWAPLRGLRARLGAVPVFVKILGVGAAVALIFGGVAGYEVHRAATRSLYDSLRINARSTATLMATALTRHLVVDDLAAVRRIIRDAVREEQDVRYILVEDPHGQTIAATPLAPTRTDPVDHGTPGNRISVLAWTDGDRVITDARAPILAGRAGAIRIGMTDERLASALFDLRIRLLLALLLSMAMGQGLALLLASRLARPIHHLVDVVKDLDEGNRTRRAEIHAEDEIGRLAQAFNRLADGIEASEAQVREKEAMRISLIDRIVTTQEDERRHIARELHDDLGQSLTSFLLQVRSARHCAPEACDALRGVEAGIQGLIQDVRRMAFALRPAILDDLGLEQALARYVGELGRTIEPELGFQYLRREAHLRRPAPPVEIALYRICQEAVSNALRHGAPHTVSVVVVHSAARISLLVEDDGGGFDPAAVASPADRGLGLAGIRERVHLLAGEILIESSPGTGCVVRVTLPTTGGVS